MSTPKTQLRTAILDLLESRSPDTSICPSEAARKAFPDDWRDYMATCREAATALAREGKVEICQGGEPVDPGELRGPIRLRRRR